MNKQQPEEKNFRIRPATPKINLLMQKKQAQRKQNPFSPEEVKRKAMPAKLEKITSIPLPKMMAMPVKV